MSGEIQARYRSRVWESDDGQCVILRAELEPGRKPVTLKGAPDAGPRLVPGLTYRWLGKWESHPIHGEQFAFVSFIALRSTDRQGVLSYLEACAEGVGPVRAGQLWDRYGPHAVETLRLNPDAVAEAGILSEDVARQASQSLHDNGAFEETKVELFGLLSGRGFQLATLIRELLARFGSRAPERIRRNPYTLLRHTSAGWARVDKLYLDLGGSPVRLKRQALCALHEVRGDNSGNTWLPVKQVAAKIRLAVGGKADPPRALRLAIRARLLARRRDARDELWIADAKRAANESAIGDCVRRLGA